MILPWDDDRDIKGKIVPLERVVLLSVLPWVRGRAG